MLALIDGDIVAFRCAASTMLEGDTKVPAPWGIVRARADEMIKSILAGCISEGGKYKVWLSGAKNFRHELYPEYKANRKAPRPQYLEDLKEYLIVEYGAKVADGIEADDAIGIDATSNPDSVICSIDKDLRQIPGHHFNFVKGVLDHVTEQQAMVFFYRQMLIGDPSDNVRGVDGVGVVKAARRLPDGISERDAFDMVRDSFRSDDRFLLTGDLLYVLKREGERWSRNRQHWMYPDHSGREPVVTSTFSTSTTNISTDEQAQDNSTLGDSMESSSPVTLVPLT